MDTTSDGNDYARGNDGPTEWPTVRWETLPEFRCPICSGTVRTVPAVNAPILRAGPCNGCGATFPLAALPPKG